MAAPQPPPDPLPVLTPHELPCYRREPGHALKALPGHAPARWQPRQQLAGVVTGQRSRTTASGPPSGAARTGRQH